MNERDLVDPLKAAIMRADATWVSQPSHLRRRLEEELGPDARRHRAQIHQLVVAAEERIPIRLKRNGWSPGERDELGHLLVATRGWTAEASDWAVATWAAALGLTDERPSAPLLPTPSERAVVEPTSPRPREPGAFVGPTDIPSEQFGTATEMPYEHFGGATELPVNDPAPSVAPRPRSGKPPKALPKGGRGCVRHASKFLGHPLDAAYVAKTRHTPALLLLALPIGLAAFVLPALSGVLLLVFMLIMAFGSQLWPARIVAVQGDDVWLLSKRKGLSIKPKAVLAHGTRSDIEFAGGWPFPSVRFAGERLWFQYPVTSAARRLPANKSPEATS
jgi:hypothetical protein